MTFGPSSFAFGAWIVLVLACFRAFGLRVGSLVSVLGGMLVLPRVVLAIGPVPVDRRVVAGAALLLGMAVFGRPGRARPRPSWVDIPYLIWIVIPLTGLVAGGPGAGPDVANMVFQRFLGGLVPYLAGRAYFGDPDGPRRIAVAIVVAGLACIPACLYEEIVGPDLYLSHLIFGTVPNEGMVRRLGGFRPEGFLDNGLQMASWMALAATTAVWLWLGGIRRVGRIPIGVAAPALILASISCRGVYGYITLALGIGSALAARALRTRILLVGLALVPAGYMASRAAGLWDGRILDRAAIALGRPGTVGFRLDAEDGLIARVLARGPAFGFGNYVWHASEPFLWPDGIWLQLLWSGGLVGLAAAAVGLYAFPAARGLALPRRRPGPLEASSPRWALACWCVLGLVEMLHNDNALMITALIAGAIVGDASAPPPPGRVAGRARSQVGPARRRGLMGWWPLIATLAALVAVEILGRYAATTRPAAPFGSPTAPLEGPP